MPNNSAGNNSEPKTASGQFETSQEVVANWLMLYGQTYREEITEELVLLYQETLREVRPMILHRAFLRAAKTCRYRPVPQEILAAADVEYDVEESNTPKLPEPTLTAEEREQAIKDAAPFTDALKARLRIMKKDVDGK